MAKCIMIIALVLIVAYVAWSAYSAGLAIPILYAILDDEWELANEVTKNALKVCDGNGTIVYSMVAICFCMRLIFNVNLDWDEENENWFINVE